MSDKINQDLEDLRAANTDRIKDMHDLNILIHKRDLELEKRFSSIEAKVAAIAKQLTWCTGMFASMASVIIIAVIKLAFFGET